MVRLFAIPIIIFWALFAITTNTFVPKVEDVATELAGPEVPTYAPSQAALLHIGGDKFKESNSTSLTMVVLEADHSLGEPEHRYYNDLVVRLNDDKEHVQYAMDLWGGSPVTAAGAQSIDGKATYLLLRLAGNVGQIQANESVDAVRDIIKDDPPPQGLKVFVSGSAPMASDTLSIANDSLNNITIVTIVLILVMLLLVYRSLANVAVPMYSVLFEILIAKGLVSTLGHYVHSHVVVRGEHRGVVDAGRGHRLRHLPDGPLPRGATVGGGKPGRGLLHRLPRGLADHHRFRADDRRFMLLPDVRAAGLLPHHGPPRWRSACCSPSPRR